MAPAAWLLPDELKKARERRGVPPKEAAESAGVPEEVLRLWEQGEEAPTLEQAYALAQLYHCALQRFLEPTSESPPRADLRAQRRVEQDEQEVLIKEAVSLFEHWSDIAADVEALAGQRTVRLRRVATTDPATLSAVVRQEFGLKNGPIKNIRRLLEQDMGVLVFSMPLDGVSGMSWWHPRAGPTILVNRNDTVGRQNWTLAHELAHLLQSEAVVICDTLNLNSSEPRERLADSFTAEFLLPREDVARYIRQQDLDERVLSEDDTLTRLARRYGVSREATSRRLESLGFLPYGFTDGQLLRWFQRRKASERFGRRLARRRQRVKELGESLVGRAIQANLEGKITLSKLAEDLGLGVIEAEELVAEWQTRPRAQ